MSRLCRSSAVSCPQWSSSSAAFHQRGIVFGLYVVLQNGAISKQFQAVVWQPPALLIIDTCSVENGRHALRLAHGWRNCYCPGFIRSIYRTVRITAALSWAAGVLHFDDLMIDLPKAIHTVYQGRLWSRRAVLSLYIKRATLVLREASTTDRKLTAREIQVVNLVQRKASNRTIAQRLSISERTAKFHISNILRKLTLANRREIQSLNSSSSLLCPEWLLPSPQPVAHGCISFPQHRMDMLNGGPKHRMERKA